MSILDGTWPFIAALQNFFGWLLGCLVVWYLGCSLALLIGFGTFSTYYFYAPMGLLFLAFADVPAALLVILQLALFWIVPYFSFSLRQRAVCLLILFAFALLSGWHLYAIVSSVRM